MGARNVKLAIAEWSHLAGEPYKALIFMALTAKDADDPPRYWGSRSAVAFALGRRWTLDGDPAHEAALTAAKRALSTLVRKGAITPLRHAAPGRQQAYLINLTVVGNRPANGGQKPTSESPNGGQKPTSERGSESDPLRRKGQEELGLGVTAPGPNPGRRTTHRPRERS